MSRKVRRRHDGLVEIAPVGRAETTARRVAMGVAAIPAAAMTLIALVAVLPIFALALPPVLVGGAALGVWSARERRRDRGPERASR